MGRSSTPESYTFRNQEELIEILKELRKQARRLDELSFGDAAMELVQTVAGLAHHTENGFWSRLSRATHNYLCEHLREMPLPNISLDYGFGRDPKFVRVSIRINLDAPPADWVNKYDPGSPFDNVCPICHQGQGYPCRGPIDKQIGMHPERRIPPAATE